MVDQTVSLYMRDRVKFWLLGITVLVLIQKISNFWIRSIGVTLVAFGFFFLTKHLLADRHRLLRVATQDELTGLGNFRAFQERMRIETQRALRKDAPLTLILIDLDRFKKYNDTFGHRRGNELLHSSGIAFREAVRGGDEVYRFGGDEFAVVLPDTELEDARKVAVRIRQVFQRLDSREFVTISMGMADFQGESMEEFFDKVDKLLYTVKLQGGDSCQMGSIAGFLGQKISVIEAV